MDESKSIQTTWSVFVREMSEFAYVSLKENAPLMVPARFSENAYKKEKQFVEDVWLASLDVDDVYPDEFNALEEWLKSEGYAALIYTTWRHIDAARGIGKDGEETEVTYRARIVLPLSRPVSNREWPIFWQAYNRHFNELADQSCKDASRGYYVPAIDAKWKGSLEERDYAFIRELKGDKVVDVDWLLRGYSEELANLDPLELSAPDQSTAMRIEREVIVAFAKHLKGQSKREDLQDLGFKMLKGLRGEIFESPGSRDLTVFKFAKELAERFPTGRIQDLAEPFGAALSAMEEEEEGAPDLELFKEKILRAQTAVLGERERRKRERELREHEEAEKKAKQLEIVYEYDKKHLSEYQSRYGQDSDPDLFKLILAHNAKYFVFTGDKYVGPFMALDLIPACRSTLELQAKKAGFSLYNHITSEQGVKRVLKTGAQLMEDYGDVVYEIEYNVSGESYFDPVSKKLHLSEMRAAQWEPEYSEKVEAWIKRLCPVFADAERFRDYLAQVVDLSQAIAALCIVAPSNSGKSSFAEAIARLWGQRPVPMSIALDTFNEEMLKSPVLLSDEDLPRDTRGRVQTEKLRTLISSGTHSVNRKGLPRIPLMGFMRCIVTLNNIENFNFGRAGHSKADVDALKKRFLLIESTDKTVADLFDYEDFVINGAIAKHALYLAQERERADQRFGVVTNSDQYVAMGDEASSETLEFIVEHLVASRPTSKENRIYGSNYSKSILIAPGGRVFVNAPSLLEDMNLADKKKKTSLRRLASALSSLSKEATLVALKKARNRRRMWELDNGILMRYVQRSLVEEPETFQKILEIYYDAEYLPNLAPTSEQVALRDDAIRYIDTLRTDDADPVEAAE